MNLLNHGPGNSLLSDGTKPLPDPMLTSHQHGPLWLISIQVMTYIDDENNCEWIIFKMSLGFNELRDLSASPVCANFTDTHRRQLYWICNGYFNSSLSFARLPAARHFRAAGSRAKESELLLTCPTPSHRTVINPGQSKCTDWYLSFNVYMVFSSTKVILVRRVSVYCCLSVFDFIRQIIIRTAQQWRIVGACFRHRKLNQLRWQNMSAHLTNETSYWPKKLPMHRNREIYNVCDLNINPHVCFPRPCHRIGLGQSH